MMSGGSITGNTAYYGGVCNYRDSTFNRQGGTISGNTYDDVYNYGNYGESSGGESADNNTETSDNSDSESANGDNNTVEIEDNGLSNDTDFSLSDVMVICTSVVVITVGAVGAVLFFYFQKRVSYVEEKLNKHVVDG